ncbi:MAG: histidine kinase [Acidobacteriota bacterium]|nr:histidine kinase [Acidobacteriota bacterium]
MTEPTSNRRGALKIYLGYAAGVGKTFRMLEDAQKLKAAGVDVAIGYFEPHGRKDTIALTAGIETVPRRSIEYRGTAFEEMDTEAILRRRPAVCVVDEFAHSNVSNSERSKRWEDVEVLLDAGISVLTTMNVQHIESLNDRILDFTGVRVRETVPDWVVNDADEIVMIDLPSEALMNRLRRGAIYEPDKARQALQNFFREPTLRALREYALRETAHELDSHKAMREDRKSERGAEARLPEQPADRILIYVTADPSTTMLIRRGRRVASYLRAECFAVSIQPDSDSRSLSAGQREAVEKHLDFARSLHIEARVVRAPAVAEALVDFARRNQVTQIFIARSQQRPYVPVFGRSLVQQVVRLARDMQVTIVAERRHSPAAPSL